MRPVSKDYDLPLDPPASYFESGWERDQERAEKELFEELVDTEDEWCTADDAWQILPDGAPYDVAEWTAENVNVNLREYREMQSKKEAA